MLIFETIIFAIIIFGKGTVFFFFTEKVHVLHIFGENRLIEWKGCIFFFQRQKKKNTDLRSNEWMTFWTFTGKKNTKKKNTVLKEKKMALDQLLQKKKKITQFVFFFSGFWKKKNTQFWVLIDWMANELFQEKKKIRYLCLG